MRLSGVIVAWMMVGCTATTPVPGPQSSPDPAAQTSAMRFAEDTLPPPAFADPARRAKLEAAFPAVERYLAAEAANLHLPGLAVGIVIDGALAYAKGFGVQDLQHGAPVDADSVFRIASLTKSFTAISILALRDQGKLGLDEPAAKHVPELASLAYPTRDAAPITIRQLLSHGAGLPEDNPWGDRQLAISDDELTRLLSHGLSFSNVPGVAFEYSNLGFAILGRIVGHVSGTSYPRYVTERILAPLAMSATVFSEAEVPPARRALGYRYEEGAFVAEPNLPGGAFDAAGALYSSLRDMARYAAFQLGAWPPRDDPDPGPLRRSSLREMQLGARKVVLTVSQANDVDPQNAVARGYGFGFGVSESCEFDHIVAHTGGLPGYGSNIYLLPEHGVGFVTLASATYAPAGKLNLGMARILAATGALQKRVVAPAPALVAAKLAVDALIARWDPTVLDAAFADSFFLDVPREKLEKNLAALRGAHGACRPSAAIDAENALRGSWSLSCERGWIDVAVTLTPTSPPRIQSFTAVGGVPPSPELADVGAKLASLVGAWDDARAQQLFNGAKNDPTKTRARFARVLSARGACKIDSPVGGNGTTQARLKLACERYPVIVDFTVDAARRVETVRFDPVSMPQGKCLQ